MTALLKTKEEGQGVAKPTMFDLTAHFEPSAHFRYSRRVRNDFGELSRLHHRSTWLLGRFGGRAQMHSDIEGIGVASRIEVGRLSMRAGKQRELIRNAFELFRLSEEKGLASGKVERILIHFSKADERQRERQEIRQAFADVFDGIECCFRTWEPNLVELGQVIAYQSLIQLLREDGLYHHAHRHRLEKVMRHLKQEVGRYEHFKFYVRPQAVDGDIPALVFCYTGDAADRRVEAFMEGYTDEKLLFVDNREFADERDKYVGLEDYERASRRFGGLWIQQEDLVCHLSAQHVGVLYLFFDANLKPELDRWFTWNELFGRQAQSLYVNRASRRSQTFLEMTLEGLGRNRFIQTDGERFRLGPNFADFRHVTFFQLGDFRKRFLA